MSSQSQDYISKYKILLQTKYFHRPERNPFQDIKWNIVQNFYTNKSPKVINNIRCAAQSCRKWESWLLWEVTAAISMISQLQKVQKETIFSKSIMKKDVLPHLRSHLKPFFTGGCRLSSFFLQFPGNWKEKFDRLWWGNNGPTVISALSLTCQKHPSLHETLAL